MKRKPTPPDLLGPLFGFACGAARLASGTALRRYRHISDDPGTFEEGTWDCSDSIKSDLKFRGQDDETAEMERTEV